ncbi:response regulator [Asticcacaulis sp. EMRT-3]|uniref:response regulator n=1 Tax=Asticcacaulis sp. EMRT-3 TaxID=3040349 RepID=UPI0024AFBE08|nr:response regulator [Asticcacaulis sp. EMRT-3]MDI7775540.1 response regulator [Asticcacaulis sp. EMRT-3]
MADPMRVMIVEDNEALAQTTGWLVEVLGYDYRLALTARAALEEAGDFRPDVMMLDIGLPGMSGYDLCRALRALPELADTIFIAQTGWGESEHRRLTAEAGFHHHLVKPLAIEKLEAVLGDIARTKVA